MKVVPFPKFEMTEECGSSLLNFYRELGWDNTRELNPRKIQISKNKWLQMSKAFVELEGSLGNAFFGNYGPSVDDRLTDSKVRLLNGWSSE